MSVSILSFLLRISDSIQPPGEEDSADLRVESPPANVLRLRDRLASLANEALRAPLRPGEDPAWGIGPSAPLRSVDELLAAIDRGSYAGGPKGRKCRQRTSLTSPPRLRRL